MDFRVTKQFGESGKEMPGKHFTTLPAAEAWVREGMSADASMGVVGIYRVYDLHDKVCGTYDSRIQTETKSEDETESASGKGNAAGFRPTPLNMDLRLGPSKWAKDDDEKQE